MIHLALSERAATALKDYIDKPADDRPFVMDDIVAEIVSQLNGFGGRTYIPIEVGTYDRDAPTPAARAIAEAMATAGAQALNPKAA